MAIIITDMNVRPHLQAYAFYEKSFVTRALSYAEIGRRVQWITQTFTVGNGERVYRSEQYLGRFFEVAARCQRVL